MKLWTTGQISKLTGFAPRTISRWIDTGSLKGFKIPPGKDRRVKDEDLWAFLAHHDMPTVEEFQLGKEPINSD